MKGIIGLHLVLALLAIIVGTLGIGALISPELRVLLSTFIRSIFLFLLLIVDVISLVPATASAFPELRFVYILIFIPLVIAIISKLLKR